MRSFSWTAALFEQEAPPFSKTFILKMGRIVQDKRPKYFDSVKAFVEDNPNYLAKKEFFTSSKAKAIRQTENFES